MKNTYCVFFTNKAVIFSVFFSHTHAPHDNNDGNDNDSRQGMGVII